VHKFCLRGSCVPGRRVGVGVVDVLGGCRCQRGGRMVVGVGLHRVAADVCVFVELLARRGVSALFVCLLLLLFVVDGYGC
jgi:hypothetical protein